MKLRRTWPAICIWAVFLIFDIVMVASLCFFLGLFPSDKALIYSSVLTVLSILIMSVLTILLGRISDKIDIIIAAGVCYRGDIMADSAGDIIGKYSLYENAMVGSRNITPESDLLSIVYSTILKGILFFTGNFISVPFFFQIACFTIFMICGFFTVKKLLGAAASLVFTAYVAFMPVFTYKFTGLELSTDSLFMAMFGIELLVLALFLQGAYRRVYTSKAYIIWYLLVGAVAGFMAYVDAGTIIMILPFMLAVLFLKGTSPKNELIRLLFVILVAVLSFAGRLIQEQGFMMADVTLSKWANFYFHNLNTFSMFWTYTDHKIIYLLTAIAMSGVMVGFWKNRNIENVSPWLLSMLFIFATVPFMGATRMNTQVFVTVYYAFILGCVAALITTPTDETGDEALETDSQDKDPDEELYKEADPEPVIETKTESADVSEPTSVPDKTPEKMQQPKTGTAVDAAEAETEVGHGISTAFEAAAETESVPESESFHTPDRARFVPEGMVLPEDDEDADLTPHMNMSRLTMPLDRDGNTQKLKVGTPVVINKKKTPPKDDFDIALREGDDFDI